MATVLVELSGGEGVVRRDDGEIVVTQNVGDDRGQELRDGDPYRPVKTWLDGDRSLVGGLLPPGAVTAAAEIADMSTKAIECTRPTRATIPPLCNGYPRSTVIGLV